MLKLYEKTADSGALVALYLCVDAGGLLLVSGERSAPLPDAALEVVMRRYGAPFDASASISRVASLALPGGRTLQHVRHLAGYDVIARDYLLYESDALDEPVCALSAQVAAALAHLARL